MRFKISAWTLAFTGVTLMAGWSMAASPTTAPADAKSATAEVQHLRAARKSINEAKVDFEKDPADPAGHRKEILEGIDKALTAIDSEIDELLKK